LALLIQGMIFLNRRHKLPSTNCDFCDLEYLPWARKTLRRIL